MIRATLAATVLFAPALLAAQAPPQPKAREFTTNLSYVNTTGNSAITTTGADERLILRPGWRWTHTQTFGVIYG
ncbi:MAG TPA: hypothetical protein VFI13_02805, partial [Gemmatimonadales bacterium]|nr:hypothetical protein [Gemmatimonadales bacterium]